MEALLTHFVHSYSFMRVIICRMDIAAIFLLIPQMFVSLLSSSSITSKYCQDELALAYVSNKPIFPVITEASENLTQQMPTGM